MFLLRIINSVHKLITLEIILYCIRDVFSKLYVFINCYGSSLFE